jgi:septal ring factor EnvC (AmiA/AmiB activator)
MTLWVGCSAYARGDEMAQAIKQDAACQRLQKQLVTLSKQNRQQEVALEKAEAKLNDLDRLQYLKTSTLQRRYELLQKLIRAIQRLVRHGPDALAQTSNQPDELIRSVLLLRSLLQSAVDNNIILQSDVKNLHIIRRNIDDEKQRIQATYHTLTKQSQKIESVLDKRRRLLKKEIDRRKRIDARVNRLASGARSLHDLIASIRTPADKAKKAKPAPSKTLDRLGRYEFLPVQGKIVTRYGEKSSDSKEGLGTVIEGRASARVLSPIEGEIVFAGPFRMYRNILIIKHHDSYFTLIAGLDRVDVDQGQHVEAGEPIGMMGGKGRPRLYLELRRDGDSINPQAWLTDLGQ